MSEQTEDNQLAKEGTFTELKEKDLLDDVIERVVKKKGYEYIKANIAGYDQPTGFTNAEDGNILIPDITAQRFGIKSYFEVAVKTDNKQKVVNNGNCLTTWQKLKMANFI